MDEDKDQVREWWSKPVPPMFEHWSAILDRTDNRLKRQTWLSAVQVLVLLAVVVLLVLTT